MALVAGVAGTATKPRARLGLEGWPCPGISAAAGRSEVCFGPSFPRVETISVTSASLLVTSALLVVKRTLIVTRSY